MTSDEKREITFHLLPALLESLDSAARRLNRSRDEFIGQAIECYLEDLDDLTVAAGRLRDTTDPALEWSSVRGGLLR